MGEPRLIWDCGTAYDMFVSLLALHSPAKYGLRGAWARGVRARLAAPERELLEQVTPFLWPYHWVHTLPEPKDGAAVLRTLEQTPVLERLPTLALIPEMPDDVARVLQEVAQRQSWDEADRQAIRTVYQGEGKIPRKKKDWIVNILEWWSRSAEFGERYLAALKTYQEVFFEEEEVRILPALQDALERGRALAERLPLPDLLEELSQGLRLAELPQVPELVLAPSYWCTPLLVFGRASVERDLILFGARPPDASLVPGEAVPDALMRTLKALGHPTRLRILRYLSAEPMAPSQLARRLRLRAPTVIHHLDTLRLAEMVHLTLGAGDKRRYAARPEAVKTACDALRAFLKDERG